MYEILLYSAVGLLLLWAGSCVSPRPRIVQNVSETHSLVLEKRLFHYRIVGVQALTPPQTEPEMKDVLP